MSGFVFTKIGKPSALALLAVTFVAPVIALAKQNNAEGPAQVEKIVVTGTRTPKLLSDSPVSVDIIDGATVELLTQGTIAEALNYIPGVVVTQNQKDGVNVQMQGFDGDNVLVLLNDKPLIAPTGAAADLAQISALNIQQIEVIRGAASVMYGSSAMGGVINIITKPPEENELKVTYEVGSYLGNEIEGEEISHRSQVNANLIFDNWAHQLTLLYSDNTGYDRDNDHSHTPAGNIQKTFVNLNTYGKFFGLKTEIRFQNFTEDKKRADGAIAGQLVNLYYLSDVEQYQFDVMLGNDIDYHMNAGSLVSWKIDFRKMNHKETSGSSTKRLADISLDEISGQFVYSTTDFEWVAGALYHEDSLEQVNLISGKFEVEPTSKRALEAYAQGDWTFDNVETLLGGRVQEDTDYGFHSALRLSSKIELSERLKWRLGVGQGYRVPTLKEREYVFDHSALGYMVLGSVDLEPEEALSYNSTWTFSTNTNDHFLGGFDFESELNLYYTDADNLITTFTDPVLSAKQGLAISVYDNVAKATMQGADISIEFTFDSWAAGFHYSYLEARDGDNKKIAERPAHQMKVNLDYSVVEWDLDTSLNAVYKQDIAYNADQYINGELANNTLTLNFKLQQHINQHLSWRFGIENVLDEHKDETAEQQLKFDARPISSRYLSLGIGYQF
ncbi:TonB-dependent receptor plug domain-containing protein [Saccharobesus litoralis]|nr:TonB-dependent receptor [Saccharobesus litoralis]